MFSRPILRAASHKSVASTAAATFFRPTTVINGASTFQRSFQTSRARWSVPASEGVKKAVSRDCIDGAGNIDKTTFFATGPATDATNTNSDGSVATATSAEAAAINVHLPKGVPADGQEPDYLLPHPLWQGESVNNIRIYHKQPEDFIDRLAQNTIRTIRFNFDILSGYKFGRMTKNKVLIRALFLESIAAVPGSIAGMLRHLMSLRRMQRDGGWIHTLLEEAENERMHLLTFLQMYKPGSFMRTMVFISQGVFFNFFWVAYMISPKFCHRLVGYLEEEAVITYTSILKNIDTNPEFASWKTELAPSIARKYWKMSETATVRDVMAVIRADESHHRDVNHTFGDMKPSDLNPFRPGH